MQLWQYCLLVTARSLYMFRTLSASIIGSAKNYGNSHWNMSCHVMGHDDVYPVRTSKVGCILHYSAVGIRPWTSVLDIHYPDP